jgi:predicted RNA binding protein YcfA (HicA-like mRNA interferase family)
MAQQRYSQNKDIHKQVKVLVREGWRVDRRGKHLQLISPNGCRCAVADTPSDRRAVKNFNREVRRIKEGRR